MNPAKLRRDAEAAARAAGLAYTGLQLVAIRDAAQMTQVDLATLFCVGSRSIMRWEANGLRPGPEAVLYAVLDNGHMQDISNASHRIRHR